MGSVTPLHTLELVMLALLIAVAAISGVARRFSFSYPIVLLLVGIAVSFVHGVPRIPLPPDAVFLIFLPPLLFAAAWQTSWREFRYNFVPISMLAFGLVLFTALGVAFLAHFFLPNFDWRLGFLLGAVVSPTDAVAASSIAKKVGMPQRIVDILEGESLLNDATGLLLLEFGADMIFRGTTPTLLEGSWRLVVLLVGGALVGLLIGGLASWLERWIDDGPVEIAMTLIIPYTCYLAAESLHASGVIAVVACGLLLSRQSARFFSPDTRLQAGAVWDALEFLLNGFVFILMGLQLPSVLDGLSGFSRLSLLAYGSAFSAVLVALRLLWMYPATRVAHRLRRIVQHQSEPLPSPRAVFVVGWTGMRGVVALAAASSLPLVLPNGQPFLQRNLIVFLTFCLILVTLVLQGLSLPSLVRLLNLEAGGTQVCEEGEARHIILRAAIDHLRSERQKNHEHEHTYDDLLHQYQHRLDAINGCGPDGKLAQNEESAFVAVLRETTQVERNTLLSLRDEGRIGDGVHRSLERELDLQDIRLGSMA